jgi:hypothetical protein
MDETSLASSNVMIKTVLTECQKSRIVFFGEYFVDNASNTLDWHNVDEMAQDSNVDKVLLPGCALRTVF